MLSCAWVDPSAEDSPRATTNTLTWVVSLLSADTDHGTKSTLTANQPFMLVCWRNGWFRGAEPGLLQLFLWASECTTVNLDRNAVEHLEAFWHMYLWRLRGFSHRRRCQPPLLHRRPPFLSHSLSKQDVCVSVGPAAAEQHKADQQIARLRSAQFSQRCGRLTGI